MSDGPVFIRVLRGEESMIMAIIFPLLIVAGLFAYQHFVPTISDFYDPLFRVLDLAALTYSLICVFNTARGVPMVPRIFAYIFVTAILALATWMAAGFYGPMGLGYPLVVVLCIFLLGGGDH